MDSMKSKSVINESWDAAGGFLGQALCFFMIPVLEYDDACLAGPP